MLSFGKQDCGNADIVEEGTDTAIISKIKSEEDSINTPSSPHAQLSKVTKQDWVNTTSLQK